MLEAYLHLLLRRQHDDKLLAEFSAISSPQARTSLGVNRELMMNSGSEVTMASIKPRAGTRTSAQQHIGGAVLPGAPGIGGSS